MFVGLEDVGLPERSETKRWAGRNGRGEDDFQSRWCALIFMERFMSIVNWELYTDKRETVRDTQIFK